jgi:hypothetical protein
MTYQFVLAVLFAGALSSCGTRQLAPLPEDEFTSTNVHTYIYPGAPEESCEAGRRALLSQGYIVHTASKEFVRAVKQFQQKNDMHQQIEFNLVCAVNGKGSNSTTAFASAVREHYVVRKNSTSASLGVGALGSVSLPIGSSSDALIKIGSETIPNEIFYKRFFSLLESYLDTGELNPVQNVAPVDMEEAADTEP